MDTQSSETMSFFLAWVLPAARQGCATPTCVAAAPSMRSRARQRRRGGRLQHAIAVQREQQVAFQRGSPRYSRVSQPDTQRGARGWRWTGSRRRADHVAWPSATTGVDLGFDDCLCHCFGGLIPSEVSKVGLGIGWASLTASGARCPRRPPRRRGRAAGADLRWGTGCSWRR